MLVQMVVDGDAIISRCIINWDGSIIGDNSGGNSNFIIDGASSFTGSIDNVSVKEVGQDWDLGTGWSIGEDKAIKMEL